MPRVQAARKTLGRLGVAERDDLGKRLLLSVDDKLVREKGRNLMLGDKQFAKLARDSRDQDVADRQRQDRTPDEQLFDRIFAAKANGDLEQGTLRNRGAKIGEHRPDDIRLAGLHQRVGDFRCDDLAPRHGKPPAGAPVAHIKDQIGVAQHRRELDDRQRDAIFDVGGQCQRDLTRQEGAFLDVLDQRLADPMIEIMRQRLEDLLGDPPFLLGELRCRKIGRDGGGDLGPHRRRGIVAQRANMSQREHRSRDPWSEEPRPAKVRPDAATGNLFRVHCR